VQLDQLSVVLRQRNPYEAIDLGFAMAREWWRDIYLAWLAVFVPVALVAWQLLPPLWAALVVWWLKPAFDRVILHVVASEVFGSRPRLRTTLLSYFSYAWNGLLLSLIPLPFLRLALTRSFDLPIRQLESAHGAIVRQRGRQLRSRVWTQAAVLTVGCLLFEAVAFFSLVGLYDLLVPATTQDTFAAFTLFEGPADGSRYRLLAVLYFVAIALIEPLYVSAGFALYLNRRTALEGWDLEVQLRRIAQRTAEADTAPAASTPSAVTGVLVLVLTLGLLATAPDPASAQDSAVHEPPAPQTAPAPPPPERSQAAQEIKKILERKEFPHYETQTVIEPLRKPEQPAKRVDLRGFASFMQFVAEILRGLVWILLAIVALFALYWLLRRLDWIRVPERTRWTAPTTLFGLDVRPESLPDDIPAAAVDLLRAGNLLAALSLLYRGALVTLLHRDQVQLTGGDTESDCLVKTRERVPANTYAYLARLLLAWQGAAYAHRVPARSDIERLASEWPGYFGQAT
jgi:hypothetical protein